MSLSFHGSRILAPLDGSELADRALIAAACIARGTESSLILARVISPSRMPHDLLANPALAAAYAGFLEREERNAQEHIDRTADRMRQQGVAVQTLVRRGAPAATLLELEDELQVRLVVMTTHARAGMAHTALGSVADQLIRRGQVPVLLVRPFVAEARCAELTRALVPLDGSALAEAALDVALALAGCVVEEMTLLRVVDPKALPDEQALPEKQETAQHYLDGVLARLCAEPLAAPCALRAAVATGNPAHTIVARAKHEHAMVIMATHGESGTRRWFFGSVADHVVHNADAPVLLVHPAGALAMASDAARTS